MRGAVAGVLMAVVLATQADAGGATLDRMDEAIATMRIADMEGNVWTAERLRGRVTLIEFWATWCAPCLADIPYLKRAQARYTPDEFEILGVSFDVSDRRTFVSWINRQGVSWPQVFDGRGEHGPAARHFGVTAVPVSLLVGPEGRVLATDLRREHLVAAIDAAVAALRRAATP